MLIMLNFKYLKPKMLLPKKHVNQTIKRDILEIKKHNIR